MEIVKAFSSNNLHTNITINGNIENPLFRASDIGLILEISNINKNIMNYDETEKQSIISQTTGGNQVVSFLTEKGLYKILFKSRKPIAETFQNWVCDVIKEIRLKGTYNLQQQIIETQKKLEEKENETIELQKKLEASNDNSPTIYIWNTNTQEKKPELKIGITLNVHKRVKPYKQINKHGKIEFTMPILNVDIKMFEKVIHTVLHSYKVQDEVFKLDIEEAKLIIISFSNFIKLTQNTNDSDRINKMQKIYEYQNVIINNIKNIISTNESGTQTESNVYDNIQENITVKTDENTQIELFKKYIEEQCIVRDDVEISSIHILGQFRIWSKIAKKETYHAFKNYLDTHFKHCRLSIQNKNQVVYGYKGVTLKEIIYKKQLLSSDVEHFIFHSCVFSPVSKVLHTHLENEYLHWKNINKKEITNNEMKELRTYLKNSNYSLFTTIWSGQGNGQGYYGIELKSEQTNDYKKTSSTGKKVEKRAVLNNELLGTWETIAKASLYEKISSAKMSRYIKNKTHINDYFYTTI
jgi:prophage antirepressor-like protein